jgi:hypothetical protein
MSDERWIQDEANIYDEMGKFSMKSYEKFREVEETMKRHSIENWAENRGVVLPGGGAMFKIKIASQDFDIAPDQVLRLPVGVDITVPDSTQKYHPGDILECQGEPGSKWWMTEMRKNEHGWFEVADRTIHGVEVAAFRVVEYGIQRHGNEPAYLLMALNSEGQEIVQCCLLPDQIGDRIDDGGFRLRQPNDPAPPAIPEIDMSRYPDTCPNCDAPAYICRVFNTVDCSKCGG